MSMSAFRHGALHVMYTAHPRERAQELLKRIDDRLFLERQITLRGEEVWCVVCHVGSEHPPVTIMEWRDERGRPLGELSSGLIDRVAAMERDGARLAARAIKANSDKIERSRRDSWEAYEDMADDMIPRMRETRSAVLPRSQSLRQARDRQRSQGRKV